MPQFRYLLTQTLIFIALAASLPAEDLPTVVVIQEPHDYSNALQTRTEQIEKSLGIESRSWRCHLPKGYRVALQWWQEKAQKPLWTAEFKTDDLPQADGYFFTLTNRSLAPASDDGKSPTKCEIAFSAPLRPCLTTYYFFRGERETNYGHAPVVGQESELWSVSAAIDGAPKKYFWMTMRIDKP